ARRHRLHPGLAREVVGPQRSAVPVAPMIPRGIADRAEDRRAPPAPPRAGGLAQDVAQVAGRAPRAVAHGDEHDVGLPGAAGGRARTAAAPAAARLLGPTYAGTAPRRDGTSNSPTRVPGASCSTIPAIAVPCAGAPDSGAVGGSVGSPTTYGPCTWVASADPST